MQDCLDLFSQAQKVAVYGLHDLRTVVLFFLNSFEIYNFKPPVHKKSLSKIKIEE